MRHKCDTTLLRPYLKNDISVTAELVRPKNDISATLPKNDISVTLPKNGVCETLPKTKLVRPIYC